MRLQVINLLILRKIQKIVKNQKKIPNKSGGVAGNTSAYIWQNTKSHSGSGCKNRANKQKKVLADSGLVAVHATIYA